jgi:hypothetical protein
MALDFLPSHGRVLTASELLISAYLDQTISCILWEIDKFARASEVQYHLLVRAAAMHRYVHFISLLEFHLD